MGECSSGHSLEPVLSFYCVGLGNQIQVFTLGGQHPHLQRCLLEYGLCFSFHFCLLLAGVMSHLYKLSLTRHPVAPKYSVSIIFIRAFLISCQIFVLLSLSIICNIGLAGVELLLVDGLWAWRGLRTSCLMSHFIP